MKPSSTIPFKFNFPHRSANMRIEIVILVAVVATTVLYATEAAEIQVGGDNGWGRPPSVNFYSSWAASQNFTVGDVLVFTFQTGAHNVAGVTKDDYDNCAAESSEFVNGTSPFSFTLDTLQDFYFICTFPGHCADGQKLAITNLQQPSSSSAPPPPIATPKTPPLSGDEPPPTVTPPPPPNFASTILASLFFTVAFAFIAATLIIF